MKLTQERLKELLDYSPADGLFIHRTNSSGRRGKVSGSVKKDGYISIGVDGKRYMAHRLAFLWMEGSFPPDQVDHINRVRADNRWENLRPATYEENRRNTPFGSGSHKGVSWNKRDQKWRVEIRINRKTHYFGTFKCVEDAAAAYTTALQTLTQESFA